jgi:TonB family protein
MSRYLPALLMAVLLGGCASAPSGTPAELVIDCETLFATAPRGTTVASADMPRLLNPADVQRQLAGLNRAPRPAVVQALVQPDGSVSHACIRQSSQNTSFDRAALDAIRVARFRAAVLAGTAVDAWVALPVGAGS